MFLQNKGYVLTLKGWLCIFGLLIITLILGFLFTGSTPIDNPGELNIQTILIIIFATLFAILILGAISWVLLAAAISLYADENGDISEEDQKEITQALNG